MAFINMHQIYKQYEAQKILCGIDFHLEEGERVAIVGKNGSGKSTLLKLIDETIEPDEGEIIKQNGIKIRRLKQTPTFKSGLSVREAIENELVEFKEVHKRYNTLLEELSKNPENSLLEKEISEITTFLDLHNAWNLDDRIERVLKEFDLKQYENREINFLSGGEQRRVALASLLLQKPDILLLDEPTNHLDVYMVEFLEEILLKEKYTFVVISHDRYFIDRVATRVVEIEDCKLRSFKGGYENYLHQKQQLLYNMQKEHETLIKILKKEEEWLRKGVKARLKRDEGRKKRIMEMREQAKQNPSLLRKMSLELQRELMQKEEKKINKQKLLFELENVDKKIGGRYLIKNFSTRILQKDKIAIVGKNGAGKSTLLKIMLGELNIDSGKIKRGDIKIGYFDQNRKMLKDDKSLIETFCPNGGDRVDVRGKNMHVYGYLKSFLFPKEFLDKKIGILSGGEKNRVALALLFTKNYDLLILDEPTNDLDIPTINILEEYLIDFKGAVIFVSHDRYFVDKIADKLFIFKGDGVIEESYLKYSEYLEIEKSLKELNSIEEKVSTTPKKEKREKKGNKLSYKEKLEYERLPDEIEKLEEKVIELNECLSTPKCYEERGIVKVGEELQKIETELNRKIERYLELEEKHTNSNKINTNICK
jgi:ATP-binding cassette subfamily F protein uup